MDTSRNITRREALRRTGVLLGGAAAVPVLSGVLAGSSWGSSTTPTPGGGRTPEYASSHFSDRFEDLRIIDGLESDVWGNDNVVPRDADNGTEEADRAVWGGDVIKGPNGTYHQFVATWPRSGGHEAWDESNVDRYTATDPMGPFSYQETIDTGMGHNPAVIEVDGTYAVFDIGDTNLHYADAPTGPWQHKNIDFEGTNPAPVVRPDGTIVVIMRDPDVIYTADAVAGPYTKVGPWEYPDKFKFVEDQCVWREDGMYHLVANQAHARTGFYMFSSDAIDWTLAENHAAILPGITHYEDGTETFWWKMERPKVLVEDGRATHMYFAAMDDNKCSDTGEDENNSKNVVLSLTPPGEGASGPIAEGAKRIVNVNSGKVLAVEQDEFEDVANAVPGNVAQETWAPTYGDVDTGCPDDLSPSDYDNNYNQRWFAHQIGDDNVYRFSPVHTAKRTKDHRVLGVADDSTAEGASLVQWTYEKDPDEHLWRAIDNDDGSYRLENVASGMVATVKGNARANNADVIQSQWTGRDSQRWRIEQVYQYDRTPAIPSGLSATVMGRNSVELSWDAAGPGPSGIGPYYTVYVDGVATKQVEAGTSTTTVSGLSGGQHELVVTAADNPYNESSPSTRVTVTL